VSGWITERRYGSHAGGAVGTARGAGGLRLIMVTRCVTRSAAVPRHGLLAWTIVKIVLATELLSRAWLFRSA
jgi:hypothetical protein